MMASWSFTRGLLIAFGTLAMVYGARKAIEAIRRDSDEERLAPNYAYLR